MDTQSLTQFFEWCLIINGSVIFVWGMACILTPDLLYRTQTRWFAMSRETYHVVTYCLLGSFKILLILFCIVPYVALRVMGAG